MGSFQESTTNNPTVNRILSLFEQENRGLNEEQKQLNALALQETLKKNYQGTPALRRARVHSANGGMMSQNHMGLSLHTLPMRRQFTVPGAMGQLSHSNIDPSLLDPSFEPVLQNNLSTQSHGAHFLEGVGEDPATYIQALPNDSQLPSEMYRNPTHPQSMNMDTEWSSSSITTPNSFTFSNGSFYDETMLSPLSGTSMYPPPMTHGPSGSSAGYEDGLNLLAADGTGNSSSSIYDLGFTGVCNPSEILMGAGDFAGGYHSKPDEDMFDLFTHTTQSFSDLGDSVATIKHESVPMSRSNTSSGSRASERLRETNQNLAAILPNPASTGIILTNEYSTTSDGSKNSRKKIQAMCELCGKKFVGKHEAERHVKSQHPDHWRARNPESVREVWIITDEFQDDKNFLADCKSCRSGHRYREKYNGAAHLRRSHFNHQKRPPKGARGGAASGSSPSMDICEMWMKKIEVSDP